MPENPTTKPPRGHSNARVERLTRHEEVDAAMIPIEGGATVYTVRPLPTLALRREEWKTIGERMDWFKSTGSSGGVLWLEFHDLGGRVEASDLTLNGIHEAMYQCRRMIEELEEVKSRLDAQDDEDESIN